MKDNPMTLVFQYGSNMSSSRINSDERLRGDARPIGIAYTKECYDMEFDVWSAGNHCATADIISGGGRQIWGVLYDVPDDLIERGTAGTKTSLDSIEGEGTNYERQEIVLLYPNGSRVFRKAITYIGKKRKTNIKTALGYVRHILDGLEEHSIPESYIKYVKQRIIQNNEELMSQVDI